MNKTCALCRVEKPLDEFFSDKRSRTGRGSYCKSCAVSRARAWTLAHPARVRANVRARNAAQPERVREENHAFYLGHKTEALAYNRSWHANNPEKSSAQRHGKHLRREYGMDGAQFAALLLAQAGLCALCEKSLDENYGRRPTVDHDHETGAVRGLVHITCNSALGIVEAVGVERFAAYLNRAKRARLQVVK